MQKADQLRANAVTLVRSHGPKMESPHVIFCRASCAFSAGRPVGMAAWFMLEVKCKTDGDLLTAIKQDTART
jgi:hypothetical protein